MPSATFDWEKFLAESDVDLERLRRIENGFKWEDLAVEELSIPVLQAKIRNIRGHSAELPKTKADLQKLLSATFDWEKFFADSEADLERLRQIENGFNPETFNWQDLQKFLDNLEEDWVIVKHSCITEPTWRKVLNK